MRTICSARVGGVSFKILQHIDAGGGQVLLRFVVGDADVPREVYGLALRTMEAHVASRSWTEPPPAE